MAQEQSNQQPYKAFGTPTRRDIRCDRSDKLLFQVGRRGAYQYCRDCKKSHCIPWSHIDKVRESIDTQPRLSDEDMANIAAMYNTPHNAHEATMHDMLSIYFAYRADGYDAHISYTSTMRDMNARVSEPRTE